MAGISGRHGARFHEWCAEDADIYVQPPARCPCPTGWILKLWKAPYGLHQSPVTLREEVNAWFRGNKHSAVDSAETIRIVRDMDCMLMAFCIRLLTFHLFRSDSRNVLTSSQEARVCLSGK